jgi:hypothetical protein
MTIDELLNAMERAEKAVCRDGPLLFAKIRELLVAQHTELCGLYRRIDSLEDEIRRLRKGA